MSHEHTAMTTDEKLIYMANQIATFFQSQPQGVAAEGVARHINEFWDPRMRRRFLEMAETETDALSPLVVEALPAIRRPDR